MAPAGHKEDDAAAAEDGGDDGDVGQVRATGTLGVVGHQHVALFQVQCAVRPGVMPLVSQGRARKTTGEDR